MTIGLLMKGFTYTEMIEWDDETRTWWYEQVMDYRDKEKEEYERIRSSSRRR